MGLEEKQSTDKKAETSKFMPVEKPPIDELFMINFKKNGGKFIYCEDKDEFYRILIVS